MQKNVVVMAMSTLNDKSGELSQSKFSYIKTRKGEIEVYINDENMDYQDTYVERIYTLGKNVEKTDKNADKVEVVNYISYDENDLMVIRNYRLKEVE